MSNPDNSEDMDQTISPLPAPRNEGGLAFKPPARPGASLRGRKSTAALSEIDSNQSHRLTNPSPAGSDRLTTMSASSSRTPSPSSSLEAGAEHRRRGFPSSKEAQVLAVTQSARQRLHVLSEETDTQTTAAGRLGQGLLEQRRKIETLQEELAEELGALEGSAQSHDDGTYAQRYERVNSLMQRIDAQISEITTHRQALLRELLPAEAHPSALPASDSFGRMSASTSQQSYAFLSNDPSSRTATATPHKQAGVPDVAVSSPAGTAGATMRQFDRRARNAAAPSSIEDQNLVNQLQEGLVTEIRRLQGLLSEREKQIKAAEEDKRRGEEELSLWKPKAMALLEREDAMKQESWDLNIQVQDLKAALDTEKSAAKKLEAERSRINRELAKSRETADERKIQLEGQTAELDRIKTLRETETAMARKEKATMAREFSDLQTEAAKYKAQALKLEKSGVPRSVSNSILGPDQSQDEVSEEQGAGHQTALRRGLAEGGMPHSPGGFSADTSSRSQSAIGARTVRDREVSDLRGKLGLAQKKTGKDSAEKRRLREQNAELRKLLANAGVDAPADSDVESTDDEGQWVDESGPRAHPSGRAARIPKSSTRLNMASRLGLSPSSLDEAMEDQDESFDASLGEEHEQSSVGHGSIEGIDPAFAPELVHKDRRRSTIKPNTKRFSTSSPLAQTVALSEEQDTTQGDSFEEPVPRFPTGRVGATPRVRPASAVVPAAALGSELEMGLGQDASFGATSVRSTTADGSVVIHPTAREFSEQDVQTDEMPDEVGPALQTQAADHEALVAELQSHHNKHIDQLLQEHEETISTLRAAHQSERDELTRKHAADIDARDARAAAAQVDSEQVLERALSEKDSGHSAAIAAALASQMKSHEASVSEARARHTQALADQLAGHSAAVAELESKHRGAIAEQQRLHKAEVERKEHRHQQALKEKTDEHQAMVEDIHSTNDTFLAQRDAAYNAALKDRDEQVVKARAEIQRLQTELGSIRQQLADAKKQLAQAADEHGVRIKELEAAQAAHIAALAAANAVTEEAKREALDAQARAAEAAAQAAAAEGAMASRRQSISVDNHEDFQDAVAEQQLQPEEEGIRRVVLANLQDSGVQTDDESWARYQQEQLALRPQSVVIARSGETVVGPGGVTILGAQSRHRDSVGTFGGMPERAVSPTPTAFSVGAVDPSARARGDVDRSKPPVLAVPPPPSMPPPSHIPRKSNLSTTASTTQDSGVQAQSGPPGRPTSPPPAKLLRRASRASGTLKPPGEGEGAATATTLMPPRTGSRASQHPPSSYATPSKVKMARRSSNISGAAGAADNESVGSASILSRLSRRNHGRQTSGTSLASDVTSELSRRLSDVSWQGRDEEDEDAVGDVTITAGAANGPARRGAQPRGFDAETTDPQVIQAITQTMIGEYLYKYTRKTMGRAGHSEKRHRRYFWVHPYTKMLYWTIADPGGAQMAEGVSKSACIEDVRVVEDVNSSPPGLHHSSIVIQTAVRELKLTAQNRERHDVWLNALGYLVNRNSEQEAAVDATIAASDAASIRRPRSRASTAATTASRAVQLMSPSRSLSSTGRAKSNDSLSQYNDATPRPRGSASSATHGSNPGYTGSSYRSKRRNTAAREYLTQASQFQRNVDDWSRKEQRDPSLLKTAEEMLEENEELAQKEGYESLDNVRACCGGLHDVGSLAHKHHVGQHAHKPRRGSLTPSTILSGASRPSSRLSNTNASDYHQPMRPRASAPSVSSSRVASPPPQLGPLNLNVPRKSVLKNSGGGSGFKDKQSLGSMFDMPPPSSVDAARARSPSQLAGTPTAGGTSSASSTSSRARRATIGETL
ncbi:unnamed protein product [Parajaminaea phylloscopi]